jgi:hypothetical protein
VALLNPPQRQFDNFRTSLRQNCRTFEEFLRNPWKIHPVGTSQELCNTICSDVADFKLRHILHPDTRKDGAIGLNHELALSGTAGRNVIVPVILEEKGKRF